MSWWFYTRFFSARPERPTDALAPVEIRLPAPAPYVISPEIQTALSETQAKLADMETQRDRWRDLARSWQMRSAAMQTEIDELKTTTAALRSRA